MARTTAQRILILDNDAAVRKEAHQALHAAGVEVASGPLDARAAIEAQKAFKPTMLWVHADLGSEGLGALLAAMDRGTADDAVPLVLLSKDARDAPLVRTMKTGIVEVLQEPFSARLHLARLRLLPLELPDRTGELRGRGTGRDLSALFGHIIRSHRTGGVVVNEGQPDAGHAFFVNGVLQSATFRGLQKQQALGALNSLAGNIDWLFKEGADGSGALIDLDTLPEDDSEEFVISRGHGDSEVIGAPAAAPAPKVAPRVAPVVAPVAAVASPVAPAVPKAAPPVVAPAPVAAAPVGTPSAPAAAPDAGTTPVLFVDDDPALAKMFSSYFAKLGYPVLTATDGIDAIGKLLLSPSEIVIADLNMPRLDGWGFLKAVREDFRTSEMPVALFSCHDDYRESLRAMHAGAQAYYPKSLRMSALELQVRELLEPRRRFRRILSTAQSVTFNLSAVGPQWALKQVAALKVTGQLDAQDGWAVYRLHFNLGQLAQITATASGRALPKERALMSFLSSKGLEGSFLFSNAPMASMFNNQPTQVLLDAAVQALNDEQKRLRDDQLKEAKALDVNPELYSLYLTVGPPPWRPMVQALCEQKLLPRDVMTRLNVTPAELSQCLKDLVRRGVVTLRTSAPA